MVHKDITWKPQNRKIPQPSC